MWMEMLHSLALSRRVALKQMNGHVAKRTDSSVVRKMLKFKSFSALPDSRLTCNLLITK